MDAGAKLNFLKLLKFAPDKVVQVIANKLSEWKTIAVFRLGITLAIYNESQEAQEILEMFQKHYAQEMASVTQ